VDDVTGLDQQGDRNGECSARYRAGIWTHRAATAAVTVALAPLAARPVIVAAPPAAPAADCRGAGNIATHGYGVDIGSGLTIEALRARWLAIYNRAPTAL